VPESACLPIWEVGQGNCQAFSGAVNRAFSPTRLFGVPSSQRVKRLILVASV
jgi:hypothetical protein